MFEKTKKWFHRNIKDREMSIFTRQLAVMAESGMTIVDALTLSGQNRKNNYFGDAILSVARSIKNGQSFSIAANQYPDIFQPLFVSMIAVGEKSGELPEMLNHLSEYYASQADLKSKIIQAVLYPAIVFCVSIAVMFFLLLYIMPIFINVLNNLEAELPLSTRILITISDASTYLIPVLIILIIGCLMLWMIFHQKPTFRTKWDQFCLRLPFYGKMQYRLECIRLAEVMQRAISSGLDLLSILTLCRDVAKNFVIKNALEIIKQSVKQGYRLNESFAATATFDPVFVRMIAVGEKTGTMEHTLKKAKSYYSDALDRGVKKFSTVLEPLMLVIVGVMVLFLVISFMLPIYNIYNGYSSLL